MVGGLFVTATCDQSHPLPGGDSIFPPPGVAGQGGGAITLHHVWRYDWQLVCFVSTTVVLFICYLFSFPVPNCNILSTFSFTSGLTTTGESFVLHKRQITTKFCHFFSNSASTGIVFRLYHTEWLCRLQHQRIHKLQSPLPQRLHHPGESFVLHNRQITTKFCHFLTNSASTGIVMFCQLMFVAFQLPLSF